MTNTYFIFLYLFVKINGCKINKYLYENPSKIINCENCIFYDKGYCIKFPKTNKNDELFYEKSKTFRKEKGICGVDALFFQDKKNVFDTDIGKLVHFTL